MKKIIILAFFFNIQTLFSNDVTEYSSSARRSELLKLINDEMKTIRSNDYTSPDLDHRFFELLSEKTKILKEIEIADQIEKNKDSVKPKVENYKESQNNFKKTQDFGLNIIKKNSSYKKNNEIYYTLAINSRDFGETKDTEEFLKLAIKLSTQNDKTMYFSKIALAENFYNLKKYSEAIGFYEEILKNKNDEWHSKHLFNAAWCHLKIRNFKKALGLMLESFNTIDKKKYISMKDQVMNALPIFFVQADATKEGITFFESRFIFATPHLINLATSSQSKNNFATTNDVLTAALKNAQKNKNVSFELKVRLLQMDIYRESKKDELFFESASHALSIIKDNKIDHELTDSAINKIKEVAGFMQINLVKDKKNNRVTFNNSNFLKILKYFDFLVFLDPKNSPQYIYFQGETCLSIGKLNKSINYYSQAIVSAKKSNPIRNDIIEKSVTAIISTLNETNLTIQKKNKQLIFAFKNYLLIHPKSEISKLYYQKLFNIYYEEKDYKKAINTLLVYTNNFSSDEKIHQEMLTAIIQAYIKLKDTQKLSFWVRKIEDGFLNFEKKYVQGSIEILGTLLFEKYQKLEKIGKTKEAQIGYEKINENTKYPKKIRAEAAYSLSSIFLAQNNSNVSKKWIKKSLTLFNKEEISNILPALVEMSKTHKLLQRFDVSSEVSNMILQTLCYEKTVSKDELARIILENTILEANKADSILQTKENIKKCDISDHVLAALDHNAIKHFIEIDHIDELLRFHNSAKENRDSNQLIYNFIRFKFWQDSPDSPRSIEKLILISKSYPELKLDTIINEISAILEIKKTIENFDVNLSQDSIFNEEKFNNEVDQYFSLATSINQRISKNIKNSSPESVIFLQELSKIPFEKLAKTLEVFIPVGVDSKYLATFNNAIRPIIESLRSKASQIDNEKKAFLAKNHFFFELQKHDKFSSATGVDTSNFAKYFNQHSAATYSNTFDQTRDLK